MASDNPSGAGRQPDRTARRIGTRGVRKAEKRTWRQRMDAMLIQPALGWGIVILLSLTLFAGGLGIWAREQPLVAIGQVMHETMVVRLAFDEVDINATSQARAQARERRPDIFVADMAFFQELRSSLATLPRTVSAAATPEDVEASIRQRFGINAERLAALKNEMAGDAPSSAYVERVGRFVDRIMRRPFLDAATWQRTDQGLSRQIELRLDDGRTSELVERTSPVNYEDLAALRTVVRDAAERVGFDETLVGVMLARLTNNPTATFRFDQAATTNAQVAAAEAISPVIERWAEGAVIFRRGDVLTADQLELYKAELRAFDRQAETWRLTLRRLSVFGGIATVVVGIAAYVGLFCPRLRSRPPRMAWVSAMIALALLIAVIGVVLSPRSLPLSVPTPILLVAAILAIAYDRRTGLAISALLALLICLSLDLPVGIFAMLLAGIGVVVWRIDDLRQRNALVRLGIWTGTVLGLSMLGVTMIDRPMVPRALGQTLSDAGLAAIAGVLVGAITLFILPLIERAFDIATGMTLVELRDPRHPLLRELLQRAPGTYNHSLNVASIAEAAADSIGADALLTYVGALYHDVGKMNKPEYFIENQSGGINRHERLNPSMSLLVIIGHVKDGLEIARSYALPRTLHHFIEGHHGTTLVEYFYRRAVQQAEDRSAEKTSDKKTESRAIDDTAAQGKSPADSSAQDSHKGDQRKPDVRRVEPPEEIEYRYPGPKPKTKECAILMLCDAVESATRTLSEPTPNRIDQLVRSLATKRLLDGQFDQCDLTNRELNKVVESISKSVAAVYHGRVRYPSEKPQTKPEAKPESKTEPKADIKPAPKNDSPPDNKPDNKPDTPDRPNDQQGS